MKNVFEFELGQTVKISCSDEFGEILGRAEYVKSENQYFMRYKCADGRASENWWAESALEKFEQ